MSHQTKVCELIPTPTMLDELDALSDIPPTFHSRPLSKPRTQVPTSIMTAEMFHELDTLSPNHNHNFNPEPTHISRPRRTRTSQIWPDTSIASLSDDELFQRYTSGQPLATFSKRQKRAEEEEGSWDFEDAFKTYVPDENVLVKNAQHACLLLFELGQVSKSDARKIKCVGKNFDWWEKVLMGLWGREAKRKGKGTILRRKRGAWEAQETLMKDFGLWLSAWGEVYRH